MTAWEITNTVAAFLKPPGCLLLLALAGLCMLRKQRWRGVSLLVGSVLGLYVLSVPYVADRLLQSLEPPFADPVRESADAIVVLGGGKYFGAPEYGGDTIGASELMRLRYAVWLHRAVSKPLLVTGGSPEGSPTTEAAAMKTVLEREFQVPVRWMEDSSKTTDENARFSFHLLQQSGVQRIYLVTHASHMHRAQAAFERAGFTVVPAPTAYTTRHRTTILDLLPSAVALRDSSIVFHEVIGATWYRLKFALASWFA